MKSTYISHWNSDMLSTNNKIQTIILTGSVHFCSLYILSIEEFLFFMFLIHAANEEMI